MTEGEIVTVYPVQYDFDDGGGTIVGPSSNPWGYVTRAHVGTGKRFHYAAGAYVFDADVVVKDVAVDIPVAQQSNGFGNVIVCRRTQLPGAAVPAWGKQIFDRLRVVD